MFKILCRVSGGMTGTHEAFLKVNGVECEYATREEADKVAQQQRDAMRNHQGQASFRYSVVEGY